MKRPAFQFYPGDWQANSRLRRCSHEEKGIWIDVMCILHDQDEYGICRWPLKELAQAVGTTVTKLKSLVDKGVLKGCDSGQQCDPLVFVPTLSGRRKGDPVSLVEVQDGPIWFSSRMVEDEHKRTIRGEHANTPKPTPDNAPKGGLGADIGATPKPTPDNAPSCAGSSSSSSSSGKPYSEANASGGEPPKALSPDEIIFGYGLPLLTNAGTADKQARSFLGGLRKQYGDQTLIDKLRDCLREKPLQPLEWLAAALPPKGATTTRTPQPENFSCRDYGTGGRL